MKLESQKSVKETFVTHFFKAVMKITWFLENGSLLSLPYSCFTCTNALLLEWLGKHILYPIILKRRKTLQKVRGITRMTWSRFLTKDYRYRIVLETDSAEYGGHKRLDPNCEYFVDSQPWHDRPFSLLVSSLCGGNSNAALLSTTLSSPDPFLLFRGVFFFLLVSRHLPYASTLTTLP